MRNRKLILLALVLVLLLLAAAPAYRALSTEVAPYEPTKEETADKPDENTESAEETAAPIETAPDFTVYDAQGAELHLSDLHGKPVVINFWATWCPPCRAELPYFDAAWVERGEEIVFLMVDLTDGGRETQEGVRAFLDETGYGFPVYYDTQFSAAEAYAVSSIPLTVLIDAQGRLVDTHLGSMSEARLAALLDKLA